MTTRQAAVAGYFYEADAGRLQQHVNQLLATEKTPGEVMPDLVNQCDVVIGNEEDADKVFGIKAPDADVIGGKVEAESYVYVLEEMAKRFSNLRMVATTLRGSLSASHNTWSAVLLCKEQDGSMTAYTAPTYDITHIVDRVGGGDSFMGGLIFGLDRYDDRPG